MEDYTQTLKLIGKKLELLRFDLKESQKEVCGKVNINRKTLSQIENGNNFSIKILINLLHEYGRLDDFIDMLSQRKNHEIKK